MSYFRFWTNRQTIPNGGEMQGQCDENGNLFVNLAAGAGGGPTAAQVGIVTETAPASDTASSGLNGRLQRIAQRLTDFLAAAPWAATALRWQYAAAANGISNTTTAVTIVAAHASLRNYITGIQMTSEALLNATELAIRDGAGGTVIWRTKIGTAGIVNGISIPFPVPLKGTAATLLEVVTLTASGTGAVYVNAQGFQAA